MKRIQLSEQIGLIRLMLIGKKSISLSNTDLAGMHVRQHKQNML